MEKHIEIRLATDEERAILMLAIQAKATKIAKDSITEYIRLLLHSY